MHPTSRTRIKICCIQSIEEARLALEAGADALGLVAAMPSGPGPIPEERIAAIARAVPPPVATFLLTSHPTAADIVAQHRRCGTTTIQIVDRLTAPGAYAVLRAALAGVRLAQVVHVRGPESLAEAAAAAPHVDALLLDSGNPALPVKELGGTGRIHDWSLSRAIRDAVDVPVFLAGGLRPENVGAAIAAVRPFAVDVCTGVRTEGRLDPAKLRGFVAAVQALGA